MRASESQRLLFVHPPKTGGATIERVLDHNLPDVRHDPVRRHFTLAQILAEEPRLSDFWICGFVRNPWARMVSWWSMIDDARRKAENGDEANRRKFIDYPVWAQVGGYDFETFLERGPDEVERLRMPQIEFLSAPGREPDFIGRTENISADVNVIRRRIGVPARPELPHRHRGGHGPYRDYYTPAGRDRVARLFKADIDAFGYEF